MKVLVTGGTGFIGAALVRALVARGNYVRVLDNNSRGRRSRLDGVGVKGIMEGDIRDISVVQRAVHGIDMVYHLAGINGTANFYGMPDVVLDVGVRGALNLIEAYEGMLVMVSSSEVYQTASTVPTDETVPLSIPDPLNPRYSYAAAKIVSEMLAIHSARGAVIVRPHNIYGPDGGHEHVIPQLIDKIQRGVPVELWGVEQTRAFCYIDDAVVGLLIAGTAPPGIYNLGTEDEITIVDLANMIAQLLRTEARIKVVEGGDGGTERRCPDIAKLAALGYRPKVSLSEGLARTVEWYAKVPELQ